MSLSSTDLKRRNRSSIFHHIYSCRTISKSDLAADLRLSLPTVTDGLQELQKQGLVVREGNFRSTGGRPADIYRLNGNRHVAIGVEILQNSVRAAAVNLYGEVVDSSFRKSDFSTDRSFYRKLGTFVNSFARQCREKYGEPLGVGISVPAIVDYERRCVPHSMLLECGQFSTDDLTSYIELPCACMHDAESGAYAETWYSRPGEDSLILFLNTYLCNAMIIGGKVLVSRTQSSGTVEHMVIHEKGRTCYCGKHGCSDAYCSARSLLERSGYADLESFFDARDRKDAGAQKTWDSYLDDLALTIDNARMVIPCNIILSGLLRPFITDEDIGKLKEKIRKITVFKQTECTISRGGCDADAVLTGSALSIISDFINSI